MNRADIVAYLAKEKAFAETPLGKAFLKFKTAYGRAVTQDTEDSFTDKDRKSAREAWEAALVAEKEFRTLLEKERD